MTTTGASQRTTDESRDLSTAQRVMATPIVGTEFQQEAWRALAKIPFGQTISYGEQAARLGRPQSRARRGLGQRPQSALGGVAVPPGRRCQWGPHRVCRRSRNTVQLGSHWCSLGGCHVLDS
jgi:alkylated DNA nucleotide flippase Atl1